KLTSGKNISSLEKAVAKYLKAKKAYSFWNGRSALYHGIKLLGIGHGDEIILQAYTCVSVPNAIIAAGAKPVYADIQEDTLNIDPRMIKRKISKKTKAILAQHTFGIPADLQAIRKICNENKLLLIEDCAHSIGAEYNGKKVGSFGDIAIFSFGRDKVLSSVSGGFLAINNSKFIARANWKLKPLPISKVIKHLLYPSIAFLARALYDILGIGKAIIFLSRLFKVIPEILTNKERNCADKSFNFSLPNCLAEIGLQELKNIDAYNKHRKNIHDIYMKELFFLKHQQVYNKTKAIYLRHTAWLDENNQALIKQCRKHDIFLGDWYNQPIAPRKVNYKKAFYKKASCPIAEKQAAHTFNLPNHPSVSIDDANKVIKVIKSFYAN
ncbi:MAG: aminotransferase class I/II-fold pyridoxal phosphate-dependent enzyme, partial [Patescibacteria group bacterium]|nr:aminotransferase class I/II-fold pyridoxal phosphate-dependent enzyme [Patescibacteria group bacterium]